VDRKLGPSAESIITSSIAYICKKFGSIAPAEKQKEKNRETVFLE